MDKQILIGDTKRKNDLSYMKSVKRARKTINLEQKLDIIMRSEQGGSAADIARALGLPPSTVRTILSNSAKIKEFSRIATPLETVRLVRNRNSVMVEMERFLTLWYENEIQNERTVSLERFQLKALDIYKNLTKDMADAEPFSASRGWFNRYKKRANLHNITISNEVCAADTEAASVFISTFNMIIAEGGYTPQQIFNVDETGLFWKRMPAKTYIPKEEQSMPAFDIAKDRLMLLLGGNALGDFKLKPLVVYHSENPKALKCYPKDKLPVIWKTHKRAQFTQLIFSDWFTGYFCPAVEQYCRKNNLANKALLVIDSAQYHPTSLDDLSDNIKVIYMPPSINSILQPMDQEIIKTFKAYYLHRTFSQAMAATESGSAETIKEFWKAYDIKKAIGNIADAWNDIKSSTMNRAWEKLYPACIHNYEEFEDRVEQIQENIVEIGKDLGLREIDNSDVEELLDSHNEELTNDDFLQLEKQRALEDSEDENEGINPIRSLTTTMLKEAMKHLETAMAIYKENDPDSERSSYVCRTIEDAVSSYRQLYREKKKTNSQQTLIKFYTHPSEFLDFECNPPASPESENSGYTFIVPKKEISPPASPSDDNTLS